MTVSSPEHDRHVVHAPDAGTGIGGVPAVALPPAMREH